MASEEDSPAPSFEVLTLPDAGGKVLAIGPSDREGVFLAQVKGAGLRYLDLTKTADQGQWEEASEDAAQASALLPLAQKSAPSAANELTVKIGDYSVQLSKGTDDAQHHNYKVTFRDSRFGMFVASGEIKLRVPDLGSAVVCTSGHVTVISGGVGSRAVLTAVRWFLPCFSLQLLIGRNVSVAQQDVKKPLLPLREAVLGKRKRDDAEVAELFTAKRHASSDAALAGEVRERRLRPTHELVDVVLRHKCWATARALIALPELNDDLIVRLLAERIELLARVVCRARYSQVLDIALRDHLPTSQLPQILELLMEWIEAHRYFSEDTLRETVPGLPRLQEILAFLQALADGCVVSLVRLDGDLIERVIEQLSFARAEAYRTERLYTTVRAACRFSKPVRPTGTAPLVEVTLVDF